MLVRKLRKRFKGKFSCQLYVLIQLAAPAPIVDYILAEEPIWWTNQRTQEDQSAMTVAYHEFAGLVDRT